MQPLTGLRILDLTKLLPGPWSTMLLGDLGAEVLKIESPYQGGDNSRAGRPRYAGQGRSESVYFCNVNRNKRSLVLDLKKKEDRETLLSLVRDADVMIESFRPGVADRLGIGYRSVSALNPRIIYCAISGYGQTGPLKHLAGHDLNIAGMSGLLQINPDQQPTMPNMLMGDYAGGVMALVGILAAIAQRERKGTGSYIDVSMLDALVSWTNVQMTGVFARTLDSAQTSAIEGWGGNPRYNIYKTKDGRYVTASLLEKKYWDALCQHCGREDLINDQETEDDRLTTHGDRGIQYRAFLTDLFLRKTRDAWVAELQAKEIPVCPVLTPEEVFSANTKAQRDWFFQMDLPHLGVSVPQNGFPFRMIAPDGASLLAAHRPPPALGEANGEYMLAKAWHQ